MQVSDKGFHWWVVGSIKYPQLLDLPKWESRRNYDVWIEGYLATGMEGIPMKARYLGNFAGNTFENACAMWALTSDSEDLYDAKTNKYWGCKLFDNEYSAQTFERNLAAKRKVVEDYL